MRPQQIPPQRLLTISAVCLVLFIICMGLLFSGCASSSTGRWLNVAVVGSGVADLATTQQAIQSGRGREGNVVMRVGPVGQVVLKGLGTAVVIYAARQLEQTHPVLAHVVRGITITAWSLAAWHNGRMGR